SHVSLSPEHGEKDREEGDETGSLPCSILSFFLDADDGYGLDVVARKRFGLVLKGLPTVFARAVGHLEDEIGPFVVRVPTVLLLCHCLSVALLVLQSIEEGVALQEDSDGGEVFLIGSVVDLVDVSGGIVLSFATIGDARTHHSVVCTALDEQLHFDCVIRAHGVRVIPCDDSILVSCEPRQVILSASGFLLVVIGSDGSAKRLFCARLLVQDDDQVVHRDVAAILHLAENREVLDHLLIILSGRRGEKKGD
ncbi:hypothetical protein PENTCL1PPCAC_5519, partial [Pristionchus entomophagus]